MYIKYICGYCENFYCGNCELNEEKTVDVLDKACNDFEALKCRKRR